MNILKVFFGGAEENDDESRRRLFCELTSELEAQATCGYPNSNVVDTAKRMREILVRSKILLSKNEKIRLVKLMNQAKVRALLRDDEHGHNIFQSLDSISADVTRLL